MPEEIIEQSKMGGHRGKKSWRMDLICRVFLQCLGETLGEGEFKYGRSIVNTLQANWKGLDITTDQSPINHAMDHLAAYADGDTEEDHLGHAAANLMFMAWFVRDPESPYYGMTYPEILALRPGPKGVPSEKLDSMFASVTDLTD